MTSTKIAKGAIISLLLAAFLPYSAVPASGQGIPVPGTKVSLVPPARFALADQYPGFESVAEQATIMVTELPGPAADMLRGMTGQALASRGMTLIAAEDVIIHGHPARVLNVSQRTANADVQKWMLIAGDPGITVMIVGTFPPAGSASTGAAIRRSLLSTSWQTASAQSPFEGLPFHITPTARLKLARRVSNMLMLTESGTTGSPGSSEALYVAGHSIGRGQLEDVRAFSEDRARQINFVKNVRNFTGSNVQLDGLSAYELEADGVDARTGAPMRVYQVIVPDDTGYYILQGISRAAAAGDLFPHFKAVTASFRRTGGQ